MDEKKIPPDILGKMYVKLSLNVEEKDNGCIETLYNPAAKMHVDIQVSAGARGSSKTYHAKAHRLSYIMNTGEIPENKMVLHTCDNPRCINPEHLMLGDHTENMKQMRERGRSLVGEKNTNSKLTPEQVHEIRNSDVSGVWLSEVYGIAQSTISMIRNGKRWRELV